MYSARILLVPLLVDEEAVPGYDTLLKPAELSMETRHAGT